MASDRFNLLWLSSNSVLLIPLITDPATDPMLESYKKSLNTELSVGKNSYSLDSGRTLLAKWGTLSTKTSDKSHDLVDYIYTRFLDEIRNGLFLMQPLL